MGTTQTKQILLKSGDKKLTQKSNLQRHKRHRSLHLNIKLGAGLLQGLMSLIVDADDTNIYLALDLIFY